MSSPRRLALRRALFRVHEWIGVILAILIVPLSLSGSALVWREPIDRALNPDRYAVTGTALLPPQAYADAARAVLKPGERIASLQLPRGRGPVTVSVLAAGMPARPGPQGRSTVWLDPPTARVLGRGPAMAGAMRVFHDLHGSLLVPGPGRTAVGWLGVAMALMSATGLWLWWPLTGGFVRGLRWRRRDEVDANLHYRFGFWVALPLFVLSLTGIAIAFPSLTGQRAPAGGVAMRAPPLARPALPLARVVASGATIASGPLRQIGWPTEKSPDWTLTYAKGVVHVADDSGVALAAPARDTGGLARLMRTIHSGEGTGIVWQAIIFVAGLVPALLAVTGLLLWWRARGRQRELARRRAA